ncbi:MAG: UvrD-helicase domain-containing protein [Anaerolineae bacterium]
MHSILSLLTFTDDQHRAVTTREADIAVTAGAGSGKTRALVGRYVRLLEDGLPPRSVVAITFTEKAAREMRTRIRRLIQQWLTERPAGIERSRWEETYAELDAAPIGTIHSLCATILRTHPAEAGVDPAFEVLDEGAATALRAQAVETALVWAANDPQAASLFSLLTENGLRQSIAALLENRLDATIAFDSVSSDPLARWRAEITTPIATFLDDPAIRDAVADLDALRADGTLADLAGDTLGTAIVDFFERWDATASAWEASELTAVFQQLREARRAMLPHKGRKDNWPDIEIPRHALSTIRDNYDAALGDLLKHPVDWSLERQAAVALPHLRAVFEKAHNAYTQAKEQRQALDFDDLEAGAVALLENHSDVRTYWQAEVRSVLVDEFQDTNDRQRRIVYALTGLGRGAGERGSGGATEPGGHSSAEAMAVGDLPVPLPGGQPPETGGRGSTVLFVVGDAKQSIYRFRGADVTVFREVQHHIDQAGGKIIDLDLTFRAHEPLLRQMNALLAPIMQTEEDRDRPYLVPFAPLRAHRPTPDDGVREPYVEFCLGVGDTADEGRQAAANALARRLSVLHDEERVDWGDIGLLFRASTSFPHYEDALQQASIPFVTVAGRGFYDRPEIRDLLNALRAVADPADDRALAGLLRSPAFALTDGALYLLRRGEDGRKRNLWAALHGDLSLLDDDDRSRVRRARQIVTELSRLVGRTTVAQILKHFLDLTHYRTILRFPVRDGSSAVGGERARRNVDKLLADAHASRLVSVGEFLEYLQTLRDVAAREGEAPVEAGDAVQLMTVHKAKGLEFSVVVIADAGHSGRGRTPAVLLDPALGPVIQLQGDDEARSIVRRLAALADQDKDDAEERRLLYVAATRAREKLLISGHVKASTAKSHPGKLLLQGWLKQLGDIVGLDQVRVEEPLEKPVTVALTEVGGRPIGCSISPNTTAAGVADLTTGRRHFDPACPERGERAQGRQPAAELQASGSSAKKAVDVDFPPPLLRQVTEKPLEQVDETVRAREAEPPPRVWRVVPTAERPRGPAWVVGTLVHEALRRWHFPDRAGFDELLRLRAMEAGLTDESELNATITDARRLLVRLQSEPLYAELDGVRRHHEVPYTIERAGQIKAGKIDLLYQHAGRWRIVDFKTDEIRTEQVLREKVTQHAQQVRDYMEAVCQLLDVEAEGWLCYLDVASKVRHVKVEPA